MPLLLARTHYSMLAGPAAPRTLCEEAVLRGHEHLVLADTNGLYGLHAFAQETGRLGLLGIYGCEVVHRGRRVTALAQDSAGYGSLCELLSARHLDAGFDLPRACEKFADGLAFLCADLAVLPELAVRLGPSRLSVALPPRGILPTVDGDAAPPAPHEHGRKLPDPAPRWPRQQLVEAAATLGLRLVATRDVWFPRPEDHALHLLFLAVKWNRAIRIGRTADTFAELRGIDTAHASMHLPARGTAALGFEDHPSALAAAAALRAACTLRIAAQNPPIFPPFSVPAGETPASHLQKLAAAGMEGRFAAPSPAVRDRLAHELAVIGQMGFPPYFLVVHEIAELARARGIPFVGRGSAAGSLVAYCLGLTDADPIRYGLLFERFLNPARNDLPDIDLDFCWRRRDELLAAVYDRFGHDHVAMIATYNTCGPRAAYAEAAKAAGLPPAETARRSSLLPWHRHGAIDLAALVAETPGFHARSREARGGPAGERLAPAGDWLAPAGERLVLAAAQALLQAPRHLGVHPGGVVLTPDRIARHAPLERAAKGVVVTQYDMHFAEGLGLVKIDLLGNRALSIVQDCRTFLRTHGIATPELDELREDDERTAALVRTGRTLACFQVESPAMRTLLQQLEATTMDRVIQAIALVRPGPAAAGMKDAFVRRARGLEPVQAAHPLIAEVFADTFGIMLYQEDVIRAAMAVAGMDGAAGDRLRRELGKPGSQQKRQQGQTGGGADQDAFFIAGLRRGLPRAALAQVWAEMARFAGYSFCKAHAVTYGRIAWQCVWLKARWPAAFVAAMLNNDAGYYDKGVYVEEGKRLGARFLPPCVQRGALEFELVGPDTVRVGLAEVHALSARTRQAILAARRAGGPFRDLGDFLQRVQPAADEAENLVLCGALDALGRTRPELLWRLSLARGPVARAGARAAAGTAAPGALLPDALAPRPVTFPDLPEFGPARRTQCELDVLGYALGQHPVDVLWQGRPSLGERSAPAHRVEQLVPCGRLDGFVGKRVSVFGWAVAYRRHRTERGEPMAFVTIEDGTGIVEGTLFPKVFRAFGGELQGRGPFVVSGVLEERLGGVGLRVTAVRDGRAAPAG